MKLWFCYSFPADLDLDGAPSRNAPYTISHTVGRYLRDRARERGWAFEAVDLTNGTIVEPDDIIIGHPWYPTGFMTSNIAFCRNSFVLQPYTRNFVSPTEEWWVKIYLDFAKHIFFVTGEYWFDGIPASPYADFAHKMTRLDMAVSADVHPFSKRTWNPVGKRAALCIGNDTPAQNWAEVAELARTTGLKLGYCGNADPAIFEHVGNFKHFGGTIFDEATIAALCKEYDALICLHRESANPTVLLESAAWGLIPFCTEQAGYYANRPFMELRLGDLDFNWGQVDRLQSAPEAWLRARAQATRTLVEQQYNWSVFVNKLWSGIEQCL